jgi:hypothetical protein
MKRIANLFMVSMFLVNTGAVLAAPASVPKAENNPNVVAFYTSGPHAVIQKDGTILYNQQGADLVLQSGWNFQQWYVDASGNVVHTLFRNVGDDTTCNGNGLFIENPYDPPNGDTWGYYFPDGDNYCASSSN